MFAIPVMVAAPGVTLGGLTAGGNAVLTWRTIDHVA
jgi:hypothetical protein